MIARIRKSMDEKDQGFTLIELLVVMVIIGILSAIAVPVFLSQRNKAYDAAAKSDVANIGREVATYYVDNTTNPTALVVTSSTVKNGSWSLTTALPAGQSPTGTVSKDVTASATGTEIFKFTDSTNWCVSLVSKSTATYRYTNSGPSTGNCSTSW